MRNATLVALLLAAIGAGADAQRLQSTFTNDVGSAEGWRAEGGPGRHYARAGLVSLTGTGSDLSYWRRSVPGLRPGAAYRVRFRARVLPGSSTHTVVSGLDVCNRDFGASQEWRWHTFVFTTPRDVTTAFARLGQWHLRGTVLFSDFSLAPVEVLHRRSGGLVLGAGESVSGTEYEFTAPLLEEGSNTARTLASHTAPFNSNRWVFGSGSEVIYRLGIPQARQTRAEVAVNVNHHLGGVCVVEASADGAAWVEVGRLSGLGRRTLEVPQALFPAREVWLRLRGEGAIDAAGNSAPGAFQVDALRYTARLERALPDAVGATSYADVHRDDPHVTVRVEDLGSLGVAGPDDALQLRVRAPRSAAGHASVSLTIAGAGRTANFSTISAVRGEALIRVPYRWTSTGQTRLTIACVWLDGERARPVYLATTEQHVSALFAQDFGYRLPAPAGADLWWCEATRKVWPGRATPAGMPAPGAAIRMQAARREREHAQLVLRPRSDPGPIQVSATALTGPRGASIPASAVEVREVVTVRVRVPTDRTGVVGDWPDPLAPLKGPWRPRAGRQNALWITVTVPPNAPAGEYSGSVLLRGARWSARAPIRLRVWNFALPERTALRSGFGVNPAMIQRYHNLRTPEALEKVWDATMRSFARRRLNPYDPMALAPYRVSIAGLYWTGGAQDGSRIMSGRWSLRVVDDQTSASVTVNSVDLIPVEPGRRYRLSWLAKTDRYGQQYQVTVGSYDSARRWMSGRNIDLVRTGDRNWLSESVDITDRIPPDARFVRIALRPCLWSEAGEQTGVAWFDDVNLERDNDGVNLVADGSFEAERRPEVRLDFTEFDRAARRYLDGLGFNSFAVTVHGLPSGRYPNFNQGDFFGYAAGTPEYSRLMTDYGRQLEEHLERNGWLHKAYVYWYDEPEVADYPIVQEGSRRLAKYFPRLKRMMTEQFETPLFGHVQLWCPMTPEFRRAAAAARQRLGEEVWWYVCTVPKEPYCTLFIDKPAIELRMWLWQTWQNQVDGILIWETTWWSSPVFGDRMQNPWADPMAYTPEGGMWGNGDGRFFYPANRDPERDRTTEFLEAPYESLRWEMLGEGVEDWEYFRLLRERIEQAERAGMPRSRTAAARRLLTVPPTITRDLVTFTTDPRLLYRHREALARAIEALGAQ
ncbi:MAG TPA: DUF4091 domain-containing protein [Chthonomonadales bacterium]|nr:DUF4091 domain-containing protein [Chthonomonadales bacterium]